MSAIKRLLNVAKGKIIVASRKPYSDNYFDDLDEEIESGKDMSYKRSIKKKTSSSEESNEKIEDVGQRDSKGRIIKRL
jgi:hypothetical protein